MEGTAVSKVPNPQPLTEGQKAILDAIPLQTPGPFYLRFVAPRCPYCDGTGDVHDQTGVWRGVCSCPAGEALR